MRTSLLCLALIGVSVGMDLAPTSEDLHKMYGESSNVSPGRNGTPDSETFFLSPNIKLVAQYGTDRQACILNLAPEPSAYPESERHHELLMSKTKISEILEQVTPADKRGKVLPGVSGIFCAGSVGVWFQDYENVYVHHDIRCIEGTDSEKRVRVWFKRQTCPKPDWYPSKSPAVPVTGNLGTGPTLAILLDAYVATRLALDLN
jgi:hypothetical protein